MKLWELRSYEQVIKLEQDRLIYQARLQARFGRNWRRKAPIESMMPLRLAKYGVPLAETAPAGLAAAGIEPVLLPPAPAAAQELVSAHEHARALDVGESADRAGVHQVPEHEEFSTVSIEAAEPEMPVLPDVDYADAVRGYVTQHGAFPNARQFGLFLAAYAITDPATGGPLPEALLRPVLQEVKIAHQPLSSTGPGGVADHVGHVDDPVGTGPSALPDPFIESAGPKHFNVPNTPVDAEPRVAAAVPTPSAEAIGDQRTSSGAPERTSLNATSARTLQPDSGEPGNAEQSPP